MVEANGESRELFLKTISALNRILQNNEPQMSTYKLRSSSKTSVPSTIGVPDKQELCASDAEPEVMYLETVKKDSDELLSTGPSNSSNQTPVLPPGKVFKCKHCPFTTKVLSLVYGHQNQHWINKKHKCEECSCAFKTVAALICHKTEVHPTVRHRTSTLLPFKCLYCNACFKDPSSVSSHISTTHINRCELPLIVNDVDEKETTNIATVKSKEIRRSKRCVIYVCVLCPKTFHQESGLRRHLGHHTMSHICFYCSKQFPDEYRIKYHIQKVHADASENNILISNGVERLQTLKNRKPHVVSNLMDWTCPVCSVVVTGKAKLELHMASCHRNFEAYNCTECPFTTSRQNVLYVHGISHLHGKFFKCNYCSATFSSVEGREEHLKDIHAGNISDQSEEVQEKHLASNKTAVHSDGFDSVREAMDLVSSTT